jgi:DNA repair protein RecN (Recombination protein N)
MVAGVPVRVTPNGADRVELHAQTNPGEKAGPVGSISSGGEKSRIHLGLTVLKERQEEAPLWLFDEVDTGLGMDNAQPVAALLQELGQQGQVICITHLPTMAVFGSSHLRVFKRVQGGRTHLQIQALSGEERVAEIARLLGGEGFGQGDWDTQRSYAVELLKTAGLTCRFAQGG